MKPLLILLFFPLGAFAQKQLSIHVVDGKDLTPISLVHIFNLNHQSGSFTNENGAATFKIWNETDRIKVSCIGYETRVLLGDELLESDTIRLYRQAKVLRPFTVGSEPLDGLSIIKKAYKKYKRLPSVEADVFKGYYQENVTDQAGQHELMAVFLFRGYDNQHKSTLVNFMDYVGDFIILGSKKDSLPIPKTANGLRWVSGETVKDVFSNRRQWDKVRVDSTTTNDDHFNYWISVYNDKWGHIMSTVINDEFEIIKIEEFRIFSHAMVFDKDVSLAYPVFSSFEMDFSSYPEIPQPFIKSRFSMYLLEVVPDNQFVQDQVMAGKKEYDKESKNMWFQKPVEEDFEWEPYEKLHLEF